MITRRLRRPLHSVAPATLAAGVLTLSGCTTSRDDGFRVVSADPEVRAPLLAAVAELEGRWISETEFGQGVQVFSVGSAVREIMNPGEEHEMTNMYALDGNGLVMTHSCGAGNQPRMRVTPIEDGRMVFESIGVGDLKSPDEHYMASMTLVFVDEDTVEQHWHSVNAPTEVASMVFTLRRAD